MLTGRRGDNKVLDHTGAYPGAVRAELVNLGLPSSRLTTRSFGANNPLASNDTETGHQMNRRMEIVFPS
jgi:outer membrane protein OmpA-like peptidoglycan-associated protein